MDGTATLFRWFVAAMPDEHSCQLVIYDGQRAQRYEELVAEVRAMLLAADEPVLLVAESFSGPIAIALAAAPPPQLRGVVLAASFACSPVPRWLRALVGSWVFAVPPPVWAVRRYLVGDDADGELVQATLGAIRAVRASVMACRARAVLSVDVREQLRAARVPVHAIHAAHDRLVDRARGWQGVEVPTLAELPASHAVLQRRPEESAALVAAVASRLELREVQRP